ncbi:MAG: HEPN domain-containing protein [Proteobacteria bacterium]|nr:HEPN domain-containing protein [Pseudomonadota bacterium]
MKESTSRWLAFAREDLRAAEVVMAADMAGKACFHAQQAVEKALKAVIAQNKEVAPPRTHSMAELFRHLPEGFLAVVRPDLEEALDTYYLWTRYPDAVPGSIVDGMPGREDALEVIEMAKAVLAEVEDLLGNG